VAEFRVALVQDARAWREANAAGRGWWPAYYEEIRERIWTGRACYALEGWRCVRCGGGAHAGARMRARAGMGCGIPTGHWVALTIGAVSRDSHSQTAQCVVWSCIRHKIAVQGGG